MLRDSILYSHDVPRVDLLHVLHVDLYESTRCGCDRCLCAIDIRVPEAINVRTGQGVDVVYCNVHNAEVSMYAVVNVVYCI